MAVKYRLISNGSKVRIQEWKRRRFLWWVWEYWKTVGYHTEFGWYAEEFKTRKEAEEFLQKSQVGPAPWKEI